MPDTWGWDDIEWIDDVPYLPEGRDAMRVRVLSKQVALMTCDSVHLEEV